VEEFKLAKNLRIELRNRRRNTEEAESFHEFLNQIGNGTYPTVPHLGSNFIELPSRIISKNEDLNAFINEIYPNLETNSTNTLYKQQRIILTCVFLES
jgi:hypothetical protein